MQLRETPRQVVAGLLASAAFLGLYIGARLVWWVALALAVAVYLAILVAVRRQPEDTEIVLAERTTAADIARAAAALDTAAARLSNAAGRAPPADRSLLSGMSDRLRAIAARIQEDPADFAATRRFVGFFLPHLIGTVEKYVALAGRARDDHTGRLAPIRQKLSGFADTLDRIDRASLENDFAELEAEVEALAVQLKRE